MDINYCTEVSFEYGDKANKHKATLIRSINALNTVVIDLPIPCETC